jgi:hypothetical protein
VFPECNLCIWEDEAGPPITYFDVIFLFFQDVEGSYRIFEWLDFHKLSQRLTIYKSNIFTKLDFYSKTIYQARVSQRKHIKNKGNNKGHIVLLMLLLE